MKINIMTSVGKAKTPLGAFDDALVKAGISNMNLIYLSSVIPPNSEISFEKPNIESSDFGKRLYVVMARRETTQCEKIAAGIGWIMEENNKFGLFVEFDGDSKEHVKKLIDDTLPRMAKSRVGYNFSEIQYAISETMNEEGESSSAISVAVYEMNDWENQ